MRPWAVLWLVACGASAHEDTIANKPSGPQEPTCSDVGVILRGPLVSEDSKAGPARELAIAQSCRDDRWAAELITCVTSTRTPQKCTDKLTEPQRTAYQAKLDAWSAKYGGDGYGGDGYGGDINDGADARYVDCTEIVGVAERYSPPVDAKAVERDWVLAKRRTAILQTCERESWSEITKECIQDSTPDNPSVEACMSAEASHGELTKRLGDLDGVAEKIAGAKKKPRTIDCSAAVAARYGDAQWKDKLPGVKPAERRKLIAESRKTMQKSCVADKWDDTLRACLVVGGGDRCFDSAAVAIVQWGYPAARAAGAGQGLPAECLVYKAAMDRLAACDKLPQATRDAFKQSFDQVAAAWPSVPKDEQSVLGPGCAAATDAVVQVAATTCGW